MSMRCIGLSFAWSAPIFAQQQKQNALKAYVFSRDRSTRLGQPALACLQRDPVVNRRSGCGFVGEIVGMQQLTGMKRRANERAGEGGAKAQLFAVAAIVGVAL